MNSFGQMHVLRHYRPGTLRVETTNHARGPAIGAAVHSRTRAIPGIDSDDVEYVLLVGTAGYEYTGV